MVNRQVLFTDIIGKFIHYAPSKPHDVTQDRTQFQMIHSMRIYHKIKFVVFSFGTIFGPMSLFMVILQNQEKSKHCFGYYLGQSLDPCHAFYGNLAKSGKK